MVHEQGAAMQLTKGPDGLEVRDTGSDIVVDAENSPFMVLRFTIVPRRGMGEFKAVVRSARAFPSLRSRGRNA